VNNLKSEWLKKGLLFFISILAAMGILHFAEMIKSRFVENKNLPVSSIAVKKVPVADYCKARGHVQGLWYGSDWTDTTFVVDYKDSSMLIEYTTVKKSYECIRCKNAFPSFDTMVYSCKRVFTERGGQISRPIRDGYTKSRHVLEVERYLRHKKYIK
jgi:hypothetical protein